MDDQTRIAAQYYGAKLGSATDQINAYAAQTECQQRVFQRLISVTRTSLNNLSGVSEILDEFEGRLGIASALPGLNAPITRPSPSGDVGEATEVVDALADEVRALRSRIQSIADRL